LVRDGTFYYSPVEKLTGTGLGALVGLLRTPPSELGAHNPIFVNKCNILIEKVLGRGGSSTVYQGKYDVSPDISILGQRYCCKMFSAQQNRFFETRGDELEGNSDH
jgi:hypothetical protein